MANHPGVQSLGGGRYRIRTEVVHPKTGRIHEIDRRVRAKNAAEAARLLATARTEWLSNRARSVDDGPRRRLGEALDAWFAEKRMSLKASTAATYSSNVEWWKGGLGDYWLDAIEPRDVRGALEGPMRAGQSSETNAGRLRVLRTFAKETRVPQIVEGVTVKKTVRESERGEDEGRGFSLDELRALLEHGPTAWLTKKALVMPAWRRAWALVETMAWTGLRFGEATALEWQDIDLDACTIRVRRAVWHGIVDHPKATASKRVVVIPESLAETLRDHRRAMLTRQQTGVDSALVFPSRRKSSTTGYVTNNHAGKAMLRACAAAGITLAPRPWVHVLRHTWNNLLRQHASELVRQALIGHADEANNARYSKVGEDEKRAAVGAVVRLVREGK